VSAWSGVVVCADDFGLTGPTSATILDLLESGALNATSALVEGPAWSDWARPLRAAADQRGFAVGLHLDLPSHRVGEAQALSEFIRQWRRFSATFGRAPDFVDGHRHVHLFAGPRAALFALLERVDERPWVRQCRTSSWRPSAKRLVLDRLSRRFAREASARGHALNPGFGGVRGFHGLESVPALWRADVAAMTKGGVLMTHPGRADPSDPIGAWRAQEAALLADGTLARILRAKGRTLADARTPWAPAPPGS
jgi:predicted glycoside hydrolase/deacetylase ChbG (UPF0249 family)